MLHDGVVYLVCAAQQALIFAQPERQVSVLRSEVSWCCPSGISTQWEARACFGGRLPLDIFWEASAATLAVGDMLSAPQPQALLPKGGRGRCRAHELNDEQR